MPMLDRITSTAIALQVVAVLVILTGNMWHSHLLLCAGSGIMGATIAVPVMRRG